MAGVLLINPSLNPEIPLTPFKGGITSIRLSRINYRIRFLIYYYLLEVQFG
jgi:hypothetical protein